MPSPHSSKPRYRKGKLRCAQRLAAFIYPSQMRTSSDAHPERIDISVEEAKECCLAVSEVQRPQRSCKPDPLLCTSNVRDSHIYVIPQQMRKKSWMELPRGWRPRKRHKTDPGRAQDRVSAQASTVHYHPARLRVLHLYFYISHMPSTMWNSTQ